MLPCGSPDWMITDVRVSPVKARPAMLNRRGSPAYSVNWYCACACVGMRGSGPR